MNTVTEIWVDGACFPNPGYGGWAFTDLGKVNESGGIYPATNQQMELRAAIEALKYFKAAPIIIYSDSQYVVNGFHDWMPKWKKMGWRRGKKPIANLHLWKELDSVAQEYLNAKAEVKFVWVRGHSGNQGNEQADELASNATGIPENLRH